MSDRRESTEPVRVELVTEDNARGGWYSLKVVEIERDLWNAMDELERHQHIQQLHFIWLSEVLALSYEVTGNDAIDRFEPEE